MRLFLKSKPKKLGLILYKLLLQFGLKSGLGFSTKMHIGVGLVGLKSGSGLGIG